MRFIMAMVLLFTLLAPASTGAADTRQAPFGAAGGDQQGRNTYAPTGPVIPGPDYVEGFDQIESPPRDARLIADSVGHILVPGRFAADDVERLVALNAKDGAVDWVLDDISRVCLPVTTDDGRIFAALVANSDTSGVRNFSYDPVEIDAATGAITNRYTALDDDAEPRLGACQDELRLAANGILISYTRTDGGQVAGIDTTTAPMTRQWTFAHPDTSNDGGLDRIVLSPDGQTVYVGDLVTGADPPAVRVTALDSATGDEMASRVVPGSTFARDGLAHDGVSLLVQTHATGGQDDPARLMALDPGTLAERWLVAAADDAPFDRSGRMTVSGDIVVVHASGTLIGFALDDGAQRWSAELSSFSNNGSQIISDGAGRLYVGTFGGAPLEVYDAATGQQIFQAPDIEEFLGDGVTGEATLGPVLDDGRLYVLHRQAGANLPVLIAYGNGSARLDGGSGDPIDIAIQLCQYLFGPDQARTIVLARDDLFADTLAGAPLAGDHSCILFTPGGPDAPIDPRTLAEIDRALVDGGTVRVVGGPNAVSSLAAQAVTDAGFDVERLAGPGRVETAVAISDVVAAENPDNATAIVAFANNWPDAVTAGAYAAAIGAPVLLTQTDVVPDATAGALDRYGSTRVIVPGGPAVISDAVLAQLNGAQRVAGANRHATAAQVAGLLWADLADDQAFVLSNLEFDRGWALALAASPLSVRLRAPQLGVRSNNLPAETAAYLTDNGISEPGLIVLGDLTVIDEEVVTSVRVTTGS